MTHFPSFSHKNRAINNAASSQKARHAESLGVAGIMCLHDLFFRPAGADQLVDYLSLVSAAAPKTPLFFYHLPGFTGVNCNLSYFFINFKEKINKLFYKKIIITFQ